MCPDCPRVTHAVLDELDQLQHIAAHTAGVAEPALLVEPDVQRPVRLAPMVRAIAEQRLPRFLRDAAAEQFAGDLADVHVGDLPVVCVDINRAALTAAPPGEQERQKCVSAVHLAFRGAVARCPTGRRG